MDLGLEAFYGGAVGGGKSDALLMAALQFIDFPQYKALVLRRTFAELNQESAIMNRAHLWLKGRAKWSASEHKFTFPSGAVLRFGYFETPNDKWQYQSSEYHFVAFDEVAEFTEDQYTWLFSRMRAEKDLPYPIRMRAASNPGGIGHDWVNKRFVNAKTRVAPFYESKWRENPHLNYDEYEKNIDRLPPLQRRQLKLGDWSAFEGGQFDIGWFKDFTRDGDTFHFPGHESVLWSNLGRFVTVDPACTPEDTVRKGSDPDYTVVGVYARLPWEAVAVLDVARVRVGIDQINNVVADMCRRWSPLFVGYESIAFQQALVVMARRRCDIPNVKALNPKVDGKLPGIKLKLARAIDAIAWAEAGKIFIPKEAPWREDWLSEIGFFTGDDKLDSHDDQVDSLSYAVKELVTGGFVAGPPLDPYQKVTSPDLDRSGRECGAIRRGMYGLGVSSRNVSRWDLSDR
jgi:predicted phage terminase large subunit-like protein